MCESEVVVIDYGVGNLLSVKRALEYCGAKVSLTNNADEILSAKRVVLPGVGSFNNAMHALNSLNLVPVIRGVAHNKSALLGICLGMQLLLDEGTEFGSTAGIGLIPGRVISVPEKNLSGLSQKIPHIGWSTLKPHNEAVSWNGTLLQENVQSDAAYFVHSFMAVPSYSSHRIADCMYGGHKIAAVISKDNITGCQFHPEKSGEVGLKILRRFCIT
jgi:glutamine amidotransferase